MPPKVRQLGLCEYAHSLAAMTEFTALRDGDRFWYQRTLSSSEQRLVNDSRLADIIRRNTGIGDEIQADVFHVPTNTRNSTNRRNSTNTPNRNRPRRR